MSYYVYVLGSKKKPKMTYVGWTTNLKKRLLKHNSGIGAKFTRGRKWKILYSEISYSKSQAMKREFFIKKNKKLRTQLRTKL